jgi:hypothetical protein
MSHNVSEEPVASIFKAEELTRRNRRFPRNIGSYLPDFTASRRRTSNLTIPASVSDKEILLKSLF